MKKWARFLKRARDEEQRNRLNLVIVAANNHYAGLWPRIANIFRKILHDCYKQIYKISQDNALTITNYYPMMSEVNPACLRSIQQNTSNLRTT
jgi:hypothetical protein